MSQKNPTLHIIYFFTKLISTFMKKRSDFIIKEVYRKHKQKP